MWLNNFKEKHPNIYISVVSFLLSFITLLSCSVITSFIYPHLSTLAYYNDAAMFEILGTSMAKGYTPYIDVYDHKGLYLFYYTMIGGALGKVGIFFVQVILMTITYVVIYKAIKLYSDRFLFLALGFFFFTLLYAFFGQTPNDSDLEMPFNALMIYFYLKAMRDDSDKDFIKGNIFAGISAGIAVNLRMSDALLPFAFVIYFFVSFIIRKRAKFILINAGIVVGTMLVVSIPPFVHAAIGGFMSDMVEAVYINNFKYIGTTGQRTDGLPIIAYVTVPVLITAFALLLVFKRKVFGKEFILFTGITCGVTCAIELFIAFYPHYFIVLFPYVSVVLTLLLMPYLVQNNKEVVVTKPFFALVLALTLFSFCYNPIKYANHSSIDVIDINYINETINDEDKKGHVLIFGSPALYLATGIEIGYGDFSCQDNHILFSTRYSKQHLLDYLASADSHYLITNDNHYKMAESLFEELPNPDSYVKLVSPQGASITIYQHI